MRFSSRYGVLKNTKKRIISLTTAAVLAVTSMGGALPLFLSSTASAAPAAYTAVSTSGWTADRSTPSGNYDFGSYKGGDNVAALNVDNTLANTSATFYQTEGIQHSIPASDTVRASLYVDSTWTGKQVRAGLWGVGEDSSSAISAYPIIEYTTAGEGSFTGWRVFDGVNGGWTNLSGVSANVDAWNDLEIALNDTQDTFGVFINGELVTETPADVTTKLGSVILNSYNYATNNLADNYTAYWDDIAYGSFPTSAPSDVYVDASLTAPFQDGYVYGYDAFTNIQDALNAVAPGGTIYIADGTYTGALSINKDGLTLTGESTDGVVLNLNSTSMPNGQGVDVDGVNGLSMSSMTVNALAGVGGAHYAFHANQSTNVTLADMVFNGPGMTETNPKLGGVDFNGTSNITLTNVRANHFYKNGFSFTTKYAAGDSISTENVSLNSVTATDNGYAGIAFYNVGNGTPNGTGDITGVSFNGTNNLTGNNKGLEVVGDTDANIALGATPRWGITGPAGLTVVPLANVVFSGNTLNVSSHQKYFFYSPAPTESPVAVTIPADTTITADGAWDGTLIAPTAVNVTVPAPSGYTTTVGMAIKVGSDSVNLTFDKAVKLVFPGQAGKQVGFFKNGVFTEITTDCAAYLPSLDAVMPTGGDCKTVDGADLVVYTKHFTTFATYTATALPTAAGSSSTIPAKTATVTKVATVSNPATSAAETAAQVLGAAAGIAAATSKDKAATTAPKATDESSNFLGLGWWWLAVLAVVGIAGAYFYAARRADNA